MKQKLKILGTCLLITMGLAIEKELDLPYYQDFLCFIPIYVLLFWAVEALYEKQNV